MHHYYPFTCQLLKILDIFSVGRSIAHSSFMNFLHKYILNTYIISNKCNQPNGIFTLSTLASVSLLLPFCAACYDVCIVLQGTYTEDRDNFTLG